MSSRRFALARVQLPNAAVVERLPAARSLDERIDEDPRTSRARRSAPRSLVSVGLFGLLAFPVVVALVALRSPRWYPVWDQATTEMQLRDVGTLHAPLTGVGGLVGIPPDPMGSHPGPLAFYLLWPVYVVLGATSWALQVATVWVHLAAVALTLWLVARRQTNDLLLGTAAVLAVLMYVYGPIALTTVWAPYLPIMWWFVFLIAVWCVLSDDVKVLPVVVATGCFCVQTHSSYVVPVVALTALAFASVWVLTYRRRLRVGEARRALRWSLVAAGVGAVLWFPPVLEQMISPIGNLGILWRHFRGWDEAGVGVQRAFELLLIHLDPWRMATRDLFFDRWSIAGSLVPGAITLSVWAVTAVIAVRQRLSAQLVRLHVVALVAMLATVVTVSRLGFTSYYRLMWLWGVAALVLMATSWTLLVLIRQYLRSAGHRRMAKRLVWAPLVLAGAFTVVSISNASGIVHDRSDSALLERLAPRTVSALDQAHSHSARYFMLWNDATTGRLGRGLMNELLREGFDVRASRRYHAEVRLHRVGSPADAKAMIVLVAGGDVGEWRRTPAAREVARVSSARLYYAGSAEYELGISVFLVPTPSRADPLAVR